MNRIEIRMVLPDRVLMDRARELADLATKAMREWSKAYGGEVLVATATVAIGGGERTQERTAKRRKAR